MLYSTLPSIMELMAANSSVIAYQHDSIDNRFFRKLSFTKVAPIMS